MTHSGGLLAQTVEQADGLVLDAMSRAKLPGAPPACRPRRDKPGVVSAAALRLAPGLNTDPRKLAAFLAGHLALQDTWFSDVAADNGYLNLTLSRPWYLEAARQAAQQDKPAPRFGDPRPSPERRSLPVTPPPEAVRLARYGLPPPETLDLDALALERAENPAYLIWYALRRAGLRAQAWDGASLPELGKAGEMALFVLARRPLETARAVAEDDPARLFRYLTGTARLFFTYDRSARQKQEPPQLYRCFENTLQSGLAALGVQWDAQTLWQNRTDRNGEIK